MPKKVIILRGVPGSGKSYYQEKFFPDAIVCSADHTFLQPGGKYVFDPERLPEAHARCLRKFSQAVLRRRDDGPVIVVDNTNITVAEIAPYYALAEAYEWEVEVISVECPLEVARLRNIHDVPGDVIHRMYDRYVQEFSRFPDWWYRTTIVEH